MKKDDLNEPLTKGEFRLHTQDFDVLKEDVRDIREKMITRDDWDRHMVLMDALVTEMEANREERILFGQQHLRTDDMVQNHEKRICVLEKAEV